MAGTPLTAHLVALQGSPSIECVGELVDHDVIQRSSTHFGRPALTGHFELCERPVHACLTLGVGGVRVDGHLQGAAGASDTHTRHKSTLTYTHRHDTPLHIYT